MSQLTQYGSLTAPAGRFRPQRAYAESSATGPREPSWPSLPALAASVYLVSVPMLSSWDEGTAWIPQVIAVGVAVIWLIFGAILGGHRIVWAPPVMLYVLWAFWAASGLMVTLNRDYFMINWRAILKVMAITWVVSQCVRTRADLLACLTSLGGASFVLFSTGAEAILKASAFSGMRETADSRAGGTLISNANDLGVFGVVVLLGSLTSLWAFRNKFLKLIALAPVPIALYLVAASGSRMAMIGVMMVGAGIYWFHLRKAGGAGVERKLAMLVVGMMLVGGSMYYVSKNPFFFRLKAQFADKNALAEQPRLQYFARGMKATAENPVLGLGLGGFALHGLGGRGNLSHYSHSVLTETLSCTGIPGFLLYFGSQFAFFNLVRKLRKAPLPKWDGAAVNMLMVAFWTFFLMSLVSMPAANRMLWPLHGAFCGYLIVLKKRYLSSAAAHGFVR